MQREIKFNAYIEIGRNQEIRAIIRDVIFLGDNEFSASIESFNECIGREGWQYNSDEELFVYLDGQKDPISAHEFNVYFNEDGDWLTFEGIPLQYIGEKDKLGSEIYEYHIIEVFEDKTPFVAGERMVVKYHQAGFDPFCNTGDADNCLSPDNCVVVGNSLLTPSLAMKVTE